MFESHQDFKIPFFQKCQQPLSLAVYLTRSTSPEPLRKLFGARSVDSALPTLHIPNTATTSAVPRDDREKVVAFAIVLVFFSLLVPIFYPTTMVWQKIMIVWREIMVGDN